MQNSRQMFGCPMRKGSGFLCLGSSQRSCSQDALAATELPTLSGHHVPADQAVDGEVRQAEPQGMPGEEQSTIDGSAYYSRQERRLSMC